MKAKIIKSYEAECLQNDLLEEIRNADQNINSYVDEYSKAKQGDAQENVSMRAAEWTAKRDTLHNCLVQIRQKISEIEI